MEYLHYHSFSMNRSMQEAMDIFHARIEDAIEIFDKFGHTFQHRNCPICASNDFHFGDKFLNRYTISVCNVCSSEYVNPAPTNEALYFYYNSCKSNRMFANLNKQRLQDGDFRLDERITFVIPHIETLFKKQKAIKILEVGCNNGSFLLKLENYLKRNYKNSNDIQLYGIDIDEQAIKSFKLLNNDGGGGAVKFC